MLASYQLLQCTARKRLFFLATVHVHLVVDIQTPPVAFKLLLAVGCNAIEPK
jgi:hypothetical protein